MIFDDYEGVERYFINGGYLLTGGGGYYTSVDPHITYAILLINYNHFYSIMINLFVCASVILLLVVGSLVEALLFDIVALGLSTLGKLGNIMINYDYL